MKNIKYQTACRNKIWLIIGLLWTAVMIATAETPSDIFVRLEKNGYVPPWTSPTPIPVEKPNWFKK